MGTSSVFSLPICSCSYIHGHKTNYNMPPLFNVSYIVKFSHKNNFFNGSSPRKSFSICCFSNNCSLFTDSVSCDELLHYYCDRRMNIKYIMQMLDTFNGVRIHRDTVYNIFANENHRHAI